MSRKRGNAHSFVCPPQILHGFSHGAGILRSCQSRHMQVCTQNTAHGLTKQAIASLNRCIPAALACRTSASVSNQCSHAVRLCKIKRSRGRKWIDTREVRAHNSQKHQIAERGLWGNIGRYSDGDHVQQMVVISSPQSGFLALGGLILPSKKSAP